jgi:hypothetical protein
MQQFNRRRQRVVYESQQLSWPCPFGSRLHDPQIARTAVTAQLVQASVSSGRVSEDFAILLDLQAARAGLKLKSEDVEVDEGLGGNDPS